MDKNRKLDWSFRLFALLVLGAAWWLLDLPIVEITSFGSTLLWREVWADGVLLLKISLGATAIFCLLAWPGFVAFTLGGVFMIAAATGLKVWESLKMMLSLDSPDMAGTLRTIIASTKLTLAGYGLVTTFILLLLVACWPPCFRRPRKIAS